jgi:hypothetical protein
MHDGGIQWGDVATWVVGAVAAIIASQQYRQGQFRPAAKAFRDDRRVVIQIINEAGGSGLVQDVNLFPPDHPRKPAEFYWWEVDGNENHELRLVPFVLPGRASAQLVLIPRPDSLAPPDSPFNFDGIRVRVDYGDGRDSGCIDIIPTKTGRLYGTTYIPGRGPG